jgi:hypothetical protein
VKRCRKQGTVEECERRRCRGESEKQGWNFGSKYDRTSELS